MSRRTKRNRAVSIPSLDHLVGTGEQHWRHGNADGPRGLEIYHEPELGWHLDGQIARFFAPKDAIEVRCRPPELVDDVDAVNHQAAVGSKDPYWVNCGHPVFLRQIDDHLATSCRNRIRLHDKTRVRLDRQAVKCIYDLGNIAHPDRDRLHAQQRGDGFDLLEDVDPTCVLRIE